ncbi:MAG: RNA methyltransferase [Oscillospiraceae bacterium]|nr:RNA methyltransferase [Oscillospiraceae bacterium]
MVTSRQNTLIKAFRKPSPDKFVIEGEKLIFEALSAGVLLNELLVTSKHENNPAFVSLSKTVISEDLSEYISDTKSPQGVLAMFLKPNYKADFDLTNFAESSRIMLLDCVADPGNVGAIIRSCEAFGFDCVILSNDSADVFNPKVVRASAGSVFRLPCVRLDLYESIVKLKQSGFLVYATALDKTAVSLENLNNSTHFEGSGGQKLAIVIGNEGRGVSEKVQSVCGQKLYIPIKGAESLNASVAAGIVCYELRV